MTGEKKKKGKERKEKERETFPHSSSSPPFDLSVAAGFFVEFDRRSLSLLLFFFFAYAPTFLENRTLLRLSSIGSLVRSRDISLHRIILFQYICVDKFLFILILPEKPYESKSVSIVRIFSGLSIVILIPMRSSKDDASGIRCIGSFSTYLC